MKHSKSKPQQFHNRVAALMSLLVVGLLALPATVRAVEDPPNCSVPNGLGNTSQGGINFAVPQAHVGDTVPVFPTLGMVAGACRATNATGSIYTSLGFLGNFLVNVTLDPGVLVQCPAAAACVPGPYNITITAAMVGAGVNSPNGSVPGVAKSVRAVENGVGTVLTLTTEQLADFHTATIGIVTPCIAVVKQCAYPANSPTCFPAGANIDFTGYVTNCGDIRLTNVTIVDSRQLIAPGLLDTNGLPLIQPLTLNPGQAIGFKGSFTPTLAETCAGSAGNSITVRGTDVTVIGGPRASVTNSTSATCAICVNPCLTVTKSCDTVNIGSPNTVSGVVSNCGNITITNIVISDNRYGTLATVPSLAPGGSQSYSRQVTNSPCGTYPDTVTAAGRTACGAPVQATASAECIVRCAPKICVTKEVVCELPTGCADNWSHLATGAKTADNSQCPLFCYRVRVTNCGDEELKEVTVTDNKISLATCNFPATLAVGQTVECVISNVEHCEGVTNTVTASGVGVGSGIRVSTNDTAAVVIKPIAITCNVTVNGKPFISIPCDGQGHLVEHAIEVCNTGELPLADIKIDAPAIVALGGDCTNVANWRLALLPGECTNLVLCTDLITCPPSCGIAFENHITVTASVDRSKTDVCSWTRNGTNAPVAITTSTECEASVGCVQPNACRVTGGGRQDDPLVYPAGPRYVTHGGQVGAPVGNKICTVTEQFYLGNPCIHGRWTHVRHEKGGLRGNFHARYYDTLDCACLDTNTTVAQVRVPGVDGAAEQTYLNLVYGPGTVTEGVCNADDHKVAGPQPRPAPANKIVFTGVGDWADPNGRRAPRATLFRVDIEDRSEPGGSHPKGGVWPPDRYRIRIWVLTDAEAKQLKGGSGDRYLLNFRNAIAACIGLNVQDGATVPNGTAAFGVRAPDIDDGGELERGNHQIHPAIKNCDPSNPTGPGLPGKN